MGLWRPIALVLASCTSVQFGTVFMLPETAFTALLPSSIGWRTES